MDKKEGKQKMAVGELIAKGFSILLLLYAVVALVGRLHSGTVTLFLAGVCAVWLSFRYREFAAWWCRTWAHTAGKLLLSSAVAVIAALFCLFVVVSVFMIRAASSPVSSENATVIVLGAGIRGENPAQLLRGRLDAAAEYLADHPDAPCIVSGGQGTDEIVSEAEVMKRYLTEKGIAPERIIEEDKSASTYENIRFCKTIIEEQNLPRSVLIATQEFHQCRAQKMAKQAGFTDVGALTAHSPFYLIGGYWIRDFAGLCHLALLGN